MRVLVFTGKGGVGKSTLAAATAAHSARTGHRTLLISTDAAHSTTDIIDPDVQLEIRLVDVAARRARSWGSIEQYLHDLLAGLGIEHVEAAELTNVPAVDDVLALLEILDAVRSDAFDVVVIDAPPTAETMRFLTLPEAMSTLLGKLTPSVSRLSRLVLDRTLDLPLPSAQTYEALGAVIADLAELREILTGPQTSIRLITTADSVVLAETRRTISSLTLHGYHLDCVIANRVFAIDGADEWRAQWAATQEKNVALVSQELAPLPVLVAPYEACEPMGIDSLTDLASRVYSHRDPLAMLGVAPSFHVAPVSGGFDFIIPMPYLERRDVQLARVDEDLVIETPNARRVLTLPSALRRCSIEAATWREGSLYIHFVPHTELWPAHD